MPSAPEPRRTHDCITLQIRSSPARVSASGRNALSFAIATPLMGRPCLRHRSSSSRALANGCGTGVSSARMGSPPAAAFSSTTNPPPTE